MNKTLAELLKGTKYEGALVDFWARERMEFPPEYVIQHDVDWRLGTINLPGAKVIYDARKNAALASLLPAAVKAIEGLLGQKLCERDVTEAKAILNAISEATKAVEGK